jgi:hypothetical protein
VRNKLQNKNGELQTNVERLEKISGVAKKPAAQKGKK